ncbi:squamous cell carcinoma antigen recognized by T-cells 3 [Danaus plexippus]|uniref:squamous cell carcinoma antigen recognized by T-cells 3 n=1 Tax=Danaus plexippus TaxID=13037 RepID=UPI002AB02191|nr:squamous cell carcinoma antigen recognized by T-cells 3 [Danaus plexippus]XP_032526373.2 squamous cell carcinoma antigen recognized by T-cells 3 [Danaus plexippus]
MAIVEDEVRNGSEEENEIEVVVEEDDLDQDSEDSDDDDDDEAVEKKVADLEQKIAEDPYNYNDHIDLIQALWTLSELDRWRAAYDRLQRLSLLRAEHWLLRIQTEETLAHSPQSREHIAKLFQQATLDCYSIPLLSEWCSWSLSAGEAVSARDQLEEVLRRAGADPLSGKIFWDAKHELEKAKLETMNEDDPEYKEQQQRILWCLEEAVSRPLLRGEEAWPLLQEYVLQVHDQEYLDQVKKQHEAAIEYLQKITPYEDKLLTIEDIDEKCKIYQDYIDTVIDLSKEKRYVDCDSNGILKVLYDRATTECISCEASHDLLLALAKHVQAISSRATIHRIHDLCTRRCPRRHTFWVLKMQQAEHEEKSFEEVKSLFETALSKGMETYKEAEKLWMSYLEYIRRATSFDNKEHVDRLRRTFRLAWDSLAEAWGDEANDCEVPLFWARLEYKQIKDPVQGKEIFEEIFKYGENKTLSKYWEALIHLEVNRDPPVNKRLRDLHRRALRSVSDYPPAVARLWSDYERDCGGLSTLVECQEMCERKLKEWRDNYQAMKEKMLGYKQKGKQQTNKKIKIDKAKTVHQKSNKGKRKSDNTSEEVKVKRKKDDNMDVDESEKDGDSGVKRPHDDNDHVIETKRPRKDSSSEDAVGREACTLFVSNLDFKFNENNLRNKLSEFGEIVSMRVRAGVKAFGGSICYCQYKTTESVDEALKHDRTALDGRPMFLSRYSSKKTKPTFKYAMTTEKNKLFVRNLPFSHCTKEALAEIFDKYGKLNDIRIVTFKDGKPKGLAYIDYEDEESASVALSKTNGLLVKDRNIEVAVSAPPPKGETNVLGSVKRDVGGGMRRTQLSSFIPRVLQTPSTSKSSNANTSNGDSKKPLSNSDFRSLLLNK